MQRHGRQPDTFFLVWVALVAGITINVAFVPSRDFAVLYMIPVLVASLLAPPLVVVLVALVGFGIDGVDLFLGYDPLGASLIGLTTFVIVGGICVLVSAQRLEIHRRARDAERLADNLRSVTDQLRAIIQASRQADEAENAHRVAQARLDGVRLTARSAAHLVNNILAETVGHLELLRARRNLSADAAASVSRALACVEIATHQIGRLQHVVRVETWDTPVGPALDLDRSVPRDDRSA